MTGQQASHHQRCYCFCDDPILCSQSGLKYTSDVSTVVHNEAWPDNGQTNLAMCATIGANFDMSKTEHRSRIVAQGGAA